MSGPVRKTHPMITVETSFERRMGAAPTPQIADRRAFLCAEELLRMEGEEAVLTAAERADEALLRADEAQFNYWRRVEGAMQIILLEDVVGEIH